MQLLTLREESRFLVCHADRVEGRGGWIAIIDKSLIISGTKRGRNL